MTRRALLEAAAVEFGAKGFHGASLDAVAKTAGFTKGAVYSNFDSKADLFLALMDDRLEREHSIITTRILEFHGPTAELVEKIQETLAELRRDETLRALFFEFVVYAMRNPEVLERLRDFTRRQQAQIESMIVRSTPPDNEFRHPPGLVAFVSWALGQGVELYRVIDPAGATPEQEAIVRAVQADLAGVTDPGAAESEG